MYHNYFKNNLNTPSDCVSCEDNSNNLRVKCQGSKDVAAIIEGIMSAIMELVGGLLKALTAVIEVVFKGIIEAVKALGELFAGAGKALFSGVESAASSLSNFLSNLSTSSFPSINFNFVTHTFGRKVDVNLFQLDTTDLLKDQTISLVMQKLKVTQPQQSLATVLYVGGKAGVTAGYRNYERTGNLNKSIEVARNEAAIKASGQAIREIPNLADAGNPAVNYVEGKICDKAAYVAEHELRRKLSRGKE
jgi:hypothetical protein